MKEEVYIQKRIVKGTFKGKIAVFRCEIRKSVIDIYLNNIIDTNGYMYINTGLDISNSLLSLVIEEKYPNWEIAFDIKVNENLRFKNGTGNGIGKLMMKTMINDVIPKYKEIYNINNDYGTETFKLIGHISRADFKLNHWRVSLPFYLSLMQKLLIDYKFRETYIDIKKDGISIDILYHSKIENGNIEIIHQPDDMSIEGLMDYLNNIDNTKGETYINFYFY